MRALFAVGLAVVILGILSFFVAIPHSENHGIKAGDVNIGIQTHESEKVSPAISAVLLVVGAGLMIAGRGRANRAPKKPVWVTDAGPIEEKQLIEERKDGGIRFSSEIPHPDGKSHLDRTTLTPARRPGD